MAEVNRLEWEAYIKDSELMQSIQRIESRMGQLVENVKKKGNGLDDFFARAAKAATAFFTINTAENFIRQLVRVRSEFQQLEIAFNTMIGSKERADKLTQELIEFAAITPFGMKDAANAAKQLLAYGSAVDDVKDELLILGDIAAGTSQPIGELVYLYGTLRTQGRAYAMDIRQFAGRGIPIYKELATVLGVNVDMVNGLVEAGKVGFAEVQQALQNMTAAGSMFGGLMEAQSKTIQGELERLGDAYDLMLNKIGMQTEGIITDVIKGAAVIVENYQTVIDIVSGLIIVYGAYRAALIATAAIQQLTAARAVGMTAAELLHLGAIVAKTKAMTALNAVMAASPVAAYTAVIAALVAVIYSLNQVTNATAASQLKLAESHEAGASKADQERIKVEQLVSVLKDNTSSAEQKKAAYDKLIEQTGDILNSYTQEEIAAGKAKKAIDEYIESVQRATTVRFAYEEIGKLQLELDKLNRNGADAVGVWDKLGRSLKNTFAPGTQGLSAGEWWKNLWSTDGSMEIVTDQEKEVIRKQISDLTDLIGDDMAKLVTGVDKTSPAKQIIESLAKDFSNFDRMLANVANKPALDDLKKKTTEAMEALAPNDKQIAVFKKRLEQIAAVEEKYSTSNKGKNAEENRLFQASERYRALIGDIDRANQEMLDNQLSRDEQEIASTKEKYKSLRDEVRKFNADPRNKTKIDGKRIDAIENDDLTAIRTRQGNDKRLKQYQDDYQLYVRYEQLKKEVGSEYADEQLGAYQKLFSNIQSEINALQGKKFSVGISSLDEQYLKELEDLAKAHYRKQAQDAQDTYTNLLSQYKSYQQKREDLDRQTEEHISKLRADKSKDRSAEILEAERQLAEARKQLQIDEVENNPAFKKAMENIDSSSKILLVNAFSNGKATVMSLIDGMKDATEKEKATLKKLFGDFFNKGILQAQTGNYEEITRLVGGFGQLIDGSFQFKNNLDGGLGVVSDMVSLAGDLAKTLGDALGEAGKGLSSAGGIAAIAGALLSVGSALSTGFNQARQAANAESQAKIEYQNERQLKTTEAITKVLERQLELINEIYGSDRLDKYAESLETIRKNWTDINNQLDGRYMLTNDNQFANDILRRLNNGETEKQILKSWSVSSKEYWRAFDVLDNLHLFKKMEKLPADITKAREELAALQYQANLGNVDDYTQKLIDQLQAQIDMYDETLNRLREEATGSSFSSLLSDVTQLFLNQGNDAAKAWTDGFDKVMENYMIQKFSRDYLQEKMQAWYEMMADFAEGGIDAKEREKLKAEWDKIRTEGDKRMEDMRDVLGLKDKTSSLKSESIAQSITESTGSEIVGTFRAGYDMWKRQLNAMELQGKTQVSLLQVANDKLLVLNAINVNTANTVARLDTAVKHLQNIDKNLGGAYARN